MDVLPIADFGNSRSWNHLNLFFVSYNSELILIDKELDILPGLHIRNGPAIIVHLVAILSSSKGSYGDCEAKKKRAQSIHEVPSVTAIHRAFVRNSPKSNTYRFKMTGLTQDIAVEISENWPAFVYIAMTIGFSILFLKERRRETKAVKRIGDCLQEQINNRFERLELLVQKSLQTD